MLANYEINEVKTFIANLENRREGCNGEGMYCSDLDESLGCHLEVGMELYDEVMHWARQVFSGQIQFDATVEAEFKSELKRQLDAAEPLVKYGLAVETTCYSLSRLHFLDNLVHAFKNLLNNWVSPQRSIAPSNRLPLTEAASREIDSKISTPSVTKRLETSESATVKAVYALTFFYHLWRYTRGDFI